MPAPTTEPKDPKYIRPSQAPRFGIGRSSAYTLMNTGLVKSRVVKLPGKQRGFRLIEVASLLQYIESSPEEQTVAVQKKIAEARRRQPRTQKAKAAAPQHMSL